MRRTDQQRRNISAGTRRALAVKRGRGERVGELRYGWRVHTFDPRRVEPHPWEQKAIAMVLHLHEVGLSQRMIAAEVTRRLPQAIRGRGPMRPALVHAILHREAASRC